MIVVRCDACGGSVAFDAERARAQCLFCAAVALEPVPLAQPPAPPERVVPFSIDDAAARGRFAQWCRGSWWRPVALREVALQLQPLWLPAWRARAEVELHWAGLVAARTRSGRRPRAGVDRGTAEAMIPASLGISPAELSHAAPFPPASRSWTAHDGAIARELPSLTEAGARARVLAALEATRLREVAAREHLHDPGGTARLHALATSLESLPVYIGAFRFRDRPWRVVINGATGKLVGRAPIDRVKLTIAIAIGVLVLLALAWWSRPPDDQPGGPEDDSKPSVTRSRSF